MKELTKNCIEWIKNYFTNTNGKKAIIGISGGKDSTVCAALCCKAIGKENVIGVLMPNGEQKDINDAQNICRILGINYTSKEINIATIEMSYLKVLYENSLNIANNYQVLTNLIPRIRTTLLYAIAQSFIGGRVCNTSNLCEKMIGWGTLWADTIGDFSPLGNLLVSEIQEIGLDLELPKELVMKTPSDGLTGKSDEDNFGFTYDELEKVLLLMKEHQKLYENIIINDNDKSFFEFIKEHGIINADKIFKMIGNSLFKRQMIKIPTFESNISVKN